jgi:hypothetical protein
MVQRIQTAYTGDGQREGECQVQVSQHGVLSVCSSAAGLARIVSMLTVPCTTTSYGAGDDMVRFLGRLNAFDLLVTVAFGSTPATILLNPEIASFEDPLRTTRPSESMVLQAVRSTGSGDVADVAAVLLGTISVIPNNKLGTGSALKGVRGNLQA